MPRRPRARRLRRGRAGARRTEGALEPARRPARPERGTQGRPGRQAGGRYAPDARDLRGRSRGAGGLRALQPRSERQPAHRRGARSCTVGRVTLRAGEVFENPATGSRLEVVSTPRDSGGEVLVMERLLKPGTGRADAHIHHDFEHRFAVMDGQLTLELDREKRSFGVGEEVSVPVRTPHMDPYNDGNEDLRFRTEFEPATEFVEGFTAAFGHL